VLYILIVLRKPSRFVLSSKLWGSLKDPNLPKKLLSVKKIRNIHAVPTRKSRKNIRSKNILVFIVKNACTENSTTSLISALK